MTALTRPGRLDSGDAALRPIPWRRMAGITWRQHRFALAGVAVLLGALAVWLWSAGTSLHNAYAAATACHPASSAACQNLINIFNSSATSNVMGSKGPGGVLLQLVPALIGAFVGSWRPAPSGSPGRKASAGGAGRSPSWCCSGSC
jgi:hypothetical protein